MRQATLGQTASTARMKNFSAEGGSESSSDMVRGPAAAAGVTAGAVMNFYTFEAQWSRLRGRPSGRAALLRSVGASALPALFSISLDSELVAAIVEVLSAELATRKDESIEFAAAVLSALS